MYAAADRVNRLCKGYVGGRLITQRRNVNWIWKSKSLVFSRNSTHRDAICKNKMNLNTNIYVSRSTGNDHHRNGLDKEWVWSQIRQNILN